MSHVCNNPGCVAFRNTVNGYHTTTELYPLGSSSGSPSGEMDSVMSQEPPANSLGYGHIVSHINPSFSRGSGTVDILSQQTMTPDFSRSFENLPVTYSNDFPTRHFYGTSQPVAAPIYHPSDQQAIRPDMQANQGKRPTSAGLAYQTSFHCAPPSTVDVAPASYGLNASASYQGMSQESSETQSPYLRSQPSFSPDSPFSHQRSQFGRPLPAPLPTHSHTLPTQNIMGGAAITPSAVEVQRDTATTPSSQRSASQDWPKCRPCLISHVACKPSGHLNHPDRCGRCVQGKRKGYCNEPIPALSAPDSRTFRELAKSFGADQMQEVAWLGAPPPQDKYQIMLGTNHADAVKVELSCLNNDDGDLDLQEELPSRVARALGLATAPYVLSETKDAKEVAGFVDEHCNAVLESLHLICQPDKFTLKATTALQPIMRPLTLLICHQIYRHASYHLLLLYEEAVRIVGAIRADTADNKLINNGIAFALGKVYGLMDYIRDGLKAWQRPEISPACLYPDLDATLVNLNRLGHSLSFKSFNAGCKQASQPESHTEVIVRQAGSSTSSMLEHVVGTSNTFADLIRKPAQVHLPFEHAGVDLYLSIDHLPMEDSRESHHCQPQEFTMDTLATRHLDMVQEKRIALTIEALQQYLTFRRQKSSLAGLDKVPDLASELDVHVARSRNRRIGHGDPSTSSAHYSSDAPTLVESSNEAPIIGPSQPQIATDGETIDNMMADVSPWSVTTGVVAEKRTPHVGTRKAHVLLRPPHKRKKSVRSNAPDRIVVGLTPQGEWSPEPSGSQPSEAPRKKSVAKKIWEIITGPRLNPYAWSSTSFGIPEEPHEQLGQLGSLSQRPSSYPCGRTRRRSLGVATKDVRNPLSERDLIAEAKARAISKERNSAFIVGRLVECGLLDESSRKHRHRQTPKG